MEVVATETVQWEDWIILISQDTVYEKTFNVQFLLSCWSVAPVNKPNSDDRVE